MVVVRDNQCYVFERYLEALQDFLQQLAHVAAVVLASREALFRPDHLYVARVEARYAHTCVVAVFVDAYHNFADGRSKAERTAAVSACFIISRQRHR